MLQVINSKRTLIASVLAVVTLVGVYSWIIVSSQRSYAQQPQVFQRYNDPSAPYNWHSAGTSQYGLSVTSTVVVALTVPAKAVCATITVSTGTLRRTSDGSNPTTTTGLLLGIAAPVFYDCGPIKSYKFIATSTTGTLDVEYFY